MRLDMILSQSKEMKSLEYNKTIKQIDKMKPDKILKETKTMNQMS